MLQSQIGSVEINGAALAYETTGAGPSLVMLHGHLLDQHPQIVRSFLSGL